MSFFGFIWYQPYPADIFICKVLFYIFYLLQEPEQLLQELFELLFEHPQLFSNSLRVGGQNISEGNERLLKKSHTFSELSAPVQSSGMQHP